MLRHEHGVKILLLALVTTLMACAPGADDDFGADSQLHFIENWTQNPRCGFRFAMQPVIKVCVQSQQSQQVIEAQKQYTLKSLTDWLGALRQVNGQVTDRVEFSCDNAQLTMNVQAGSGTATGSPGRINVFASKQLGTHLHEWGHAFACLGDTYVGRQAGKCKPGHQESIMCWGEYGEDRLYADDIEGVQKAFLKSFPYNPPANGGVAQPLGGAAVQELFVGLTESQLTPQMLVAANKDATRVFVCNKTTGLLSCRSNTPGAVMLTKLAASSTTRAIFGTPGALAINSQMNLLITAEDASGNPLVSRGVAFKARQ